MAASCSSAPPAPVRRTSCSPERTDALVTSAADLPAIAAAAGRGCRETKQSVGIGMTPLDFFTWLSETSWSVDLHESEIAYSVIESLHVWTLCLFFGLMMMVDLRLLGWTMRTVPVSDVLDRVLPWAIVGFVLMVISGTLLVLAIPLRSYQNLFFR